MLVLHVSNYRATRFVALESKQMKVYAVRYYGQFLNAIGTFLGSIFGISGYSIDVEREKTSSKIVVTTSTNAGGITVVDTHVLLSQPSVQKAIKTLSDKVAIADASKTK